MGSVRTVSTTTEARPLRAARIVDVLVGGLLLLLALPLIALLAVLVRTSSNGPVLRRSRTRDRYGRPIEILSFRTTIDGGLTEHHRRLRAVVGAQHQVVTTRVGRLMRATRTDQLPRLVNLVRGDLSLL